MVQGEGHTTLALSQFAQDSRFKTMTGLASPTPSHNTSAQRLVGGGRLTANSHGASASRVISSN
jgi:hypothetical protein